MLFQSVRSPKAYWKTSTSSEARLVISVGILQIPVFSTPVALFSQESRFLFHRNFFGTSSGNLSVWGLHRKLCRISFVRQKQSTIQFYGTLQWLLRTTIAAPPPPLLCRHCCATTTTATPIAVPPLPLMSLRRLSHRCAAIPVAAPPKPLLHRHRSPKSVSSLSRGRVPDSSTWIIFCLFFTTTVQFTEQPSVHPPTLFRRSRTLSAD
jgi:hypothetical protein